jgi:Uma2 family endonuclease
VAVIAKKKPNKIDYPTSDGKPMAETDFHRVLIVDLIDRLNYWYADDPKTYVSGDLLVFYEKGNRRKHVAPDVFVVPGAAKKLRKNYLIWKERKRLKWITEVTSESTRNEDTAGKFILYRDILKVDEYFMFDPFGDYLHPQLKGYRLVQGDYVPIVPVNGRLPSQIIGLHLEASSRHLLLYDPVTRKYLPTTQERADREAQRAEQETQRAEQETQRAEQEKERADSAEREVERLRHEIEKHRRRNGA